MIIVIPIENLSHLGEMELTINQITLIQLNQIFLCLNNYRHKYTHISSGHDYYYVYIFILKWNSAISKRWHSTISNGLKRWGVGVLFRNFERRQRKLVLVGPQSHWGQYGVPLFIESISSRLHLHLNELCHLLALSC